MLTANPHRGLMKDEGQHPLELRSPRIPTMAGRSIMEEKHKPWEQLEAHIEVRLLRRAMLDQLIMATTSKLYYFVLLTQGGGRLETRTPVSQESYPNVFALFV